MQIVLVGHVCIDENISEHATYTGWGSSLMYMYSFFRGQLGINPVLVAPHGRDFDRYAEGLTILPSATYGNTLIFKNHTLNGHRTQRCEHIISAQPPVLSDEIKQRVAAADIICVAPLLPLYSEAYISELLQHRKAGSLAVLQPQGFFRDADDEGRIAPRDFQEPEILRHFDLVMFSHEDHPQASGLAESWARKYKETHFVVTQGAQGASWYDAKGAEHRVATLPVPEDEIVDSVGCGDTFGGAAMHHFYEHRDLPAAIKAGNDAARQKLFTHHDSAGVALP